MNLYETLLERLDGRQYSNYFSCSCPFDTHQSPALLVYEDGYFCLSCGAKGSLEYLNKKIGTNFHSPLTQSHSHTNVLPRFRQWEQEHGDLEGIATYAHKSLKAFPQFQSYFKMRKIDDYIDAGRFGYILGWLLLPVLSVHGKVLDIVVRSGKSKSANRYTLLSGDGNSSHHLYSPNWKLVERSETIYVCFGIIDSWSFEAIGLPCVTGITGKSLSAETLKPLGKKYIIVPDDGEEREAHMLANKLGWRARTLILNYPDDTKDCDNIRIQFGNEYLKNLIGA